MQNSLRVALLGGGTIGRLVLEHARRGELPGIEIAGVAGRGPASRGAALAREFQVPYAADRPALVGLRPDVVLEAASHEAVREHLVALLGSGISVIVLSAGARSDDALRQAAETAAAAVRSLLDVACWGIGRLGALMPACLAGVVGVTYQWAKRSASWNDVPYVDARSA